MHKIGGIGTQLPVRTPYEKHLLPVVTWFFTSFFLEIMWFGEVRIEFLHKNCYCSGTDKRYLAYGYQQSVADHPLTLCNQINSQQIYLSQSYSLICPGLQWCLHIPTHLSILIASFADNMFYLTWWPADVILSSACICLLLDIHVRTA